MRTSPPNNHDLLYEITQDYLRLWSDHWQDLWHGWANENIISLLFKETGFAAASLMSKSPFFFRQKRHPSRAISLNLSLTLAIWGAAQHSVIPFSQGLLSFEASPDLKTKIESLQKRIQEIGLSVFSQAITHYVVQKSLSLTKGLYTYLNHPFSRPDDSDMPHVLQLGEACVKDYASHLSRDAPTLFVIPSLINRGYILDLLPQQSFLRYLTNNGIKPFLLEWGSPGEKESNYTLYDYYEHIVLPAFDALSQSKNISVAGYCMGGIFAIALAQQKNLVDKLVLISTPWNFEAHSKPLPGFLDSILSATSSPSLPPEVIHSLFAGLNPLKILEKFQSFQELSQEEDIHRFVALEDWVNDGVSLSKKVAEDFFISWIGKNGLFQESWLFGNTTLRPEMIPQKTYAISGSYDKIVPPLSSKALYQKIPHIYSQEVPLGHTGLMTSRDALHLFWKDLAKWLKS